MCLEACLEPRALGETLRIATSVLNHVLGLRMPSSPPHQRPHCQIQALSRRPAADTGRGSAALEQSSYRGPGTNDEICLSWQ